MTISREEFQTGLVSAQTIRWDDSGPPIRLAVVALVGWSNRKGNATPMGKRIARTSWNDLTNGARNVLTRHGITR